MTTQLAQLALKPMVEYSWQDGCTLFFKQPGAALTMKDPSRFVFDCCQLLSGQHTQHAIQQRLSQIHPQDAPHLNRLLKKLDDARLLENKATSVNISPHLQTNAEFFNAYLPMTTPKHKTLASLLNKKITVLGLGGVGSNVLIQLAAMGCNNITAVDYDQVNPDNLNRQISYSIDQAGLPKTEAFKKFLNYRGIPANVHCINMKVENTEQLTHLLTDSDLTICAIDEPRAHILDWVNQACIETNTPMVCGGVDYRCLTYFSIIPHNSGCLYCWQTQARSNQPLFKELNQHGNFVSGQNTNVAIMPYIAMVTGLISNEAIKLLTDFAPPLAVGKLWMFDCITNEMNIHEQWQKQPNCPICC